MLIEILAPYQVSDAHCFLRPMPIDAMGYIWSGSR